MEVFVFYAAITYNQYKQGLVPRTFLARKQNARLHGGN